VTCTAGCGTGIVDASAAIDAALGAPPPAPAPAPPPPPPPQTVGEAEPNDSLATAQVLGGSATINGTLASTTDTDYFRLTIGAGKTVVATLAPNATSDYDLWAYNSAGIRISSSTQGTGAVDTITLSNSSTAPIAVTLRVLYFSGGSGSTAGRYTLTVK
jgi:serine protease